jgi:hypothetical protein
MSPHRQHPALTGVIRSGRSVADLVREAIRRIWLRPKNQGPVALWDGEPKRTSTDHDTIYDDP